MPTLVLTGGGSGGHITPLLSLAHELKHQKPNCRLVYIGHKGDRFDSLKERYHDFDDMAFIVAGKFRRYHGQSIWSQILDIKTLALNIGDFFKVLRGLAQANKVLRSVKPEVVFSKGGFVVVPVGLAARFRKIPIVTHDSDAVPGLANRIIAKWAVLNTTGMPPENYSYPKAKIRYVGIPIDDRIKPVNQAEQERYKTEIGFSPTSKVLLIGGAGLGARDINNMVIAEAKEMLAAIPSLAIAHLAGEKHQKAVSDKYRAILDKTGTARVRVLGFSGEFYKFTGAADLVVTRAGATTIAELAAQHKATIIIPADFLPGGHQIKNANQLKKANAVELLNNDSEPKKLLALVTELMQNDRRRQDLAKNLGSTAKTNAAQELTKILLEVAEGRAIEKHR